MLLAADYLPTLKVTEGSSGVRLACPLVARQYPLYFWTKDEQKLHHARGGGVGEDRRAPRLTHRSRVLMFDEVQRTDAGLYECTAINGFGMMNVTIRLIVNTLGEHKHAVYNSK